MVHFFPLSDPPWHTVGPGERLCNCLEMVWAVENWVVVELKFALE